MGSLAVLLKIGLFQMNGGTEENPVYELGSPIFDEIEIELNPNYYPGKSILIKTTNNTDTNWAIQKAQFNSKPMKSLTIHHDELVKGGELLLEMFDKEDISSILYCQNTKALSYIARLSSSSWAPFDYAQDKPAQGGRKVSRPQKKMHKKTSQFLARFFL